MTSKTLPNGLRVDTTFDETGTPIGLKYEKTSNCSSNCTWFDFSVKESVHGQWRRHVGSGMSTQDYSYDKVGRLVRAQDTPSGQGCRTRTYSSLVELSHRTASEKRQCFASITEMRSIEHGSKLCSTQP